MTTLLNDVHSLLNETAVARVVRPASLANLQQAIRDAVAAGARLSIAGGRHAMGGQQFAEGSVHIATTGLDRVLGADPGRGLLQIEAGADWPKIIAATHAMPGGWAIRQKQTGVDAVTLGGSISANAHGRGLRMQPIGDDIEELVLLDARGDAHTCSRERNPGLFALAIGGFGLFGAIHSATLRLARRENLRRHVDIIDLDDAMNAVYRRADEGCTYGDFQFVIDPDDERFLRRGVLACYRPSPPGDSPATASADLAPEAWLTLLKLAHEDKGKAFRLYSQHYLATDGNHYASDTFQLSTYLPGYAEYLERSRPEPAAVKESLVIGEHYVPPARLLEFMHGAREVFRRLRTEVIYGTIRAIQRDTVSFLPWAREDSCCIVFNLRTPHTGPGLQRTADTFRALTDVGLALGGSFFLTYHRHATVAQVEAAYPRFREFLALKKRHDPDERFTSAWYEHYRDAFAQAAA